jgi:hypothetical protein
LHILEDSRHGICRQRVRPGVHGFDHEMSELLISGMRLFYVSFGQIAHLLRDFEWGIGHKFLLEGDWS